MSTLGAASGLSPPGTAKDTKTSGAIQEGDPPVILSCLPWRFEGRSRSVLVEASTLQLRHFLALNRRVQLQACGGAYNSQRRIYPARFGGGSAQQDRPEEVDERSKGTPIDKLLDKHELLCVYVDTHAMKRDDAGVPQIAQVTQFIGKAPRARGDVERQGDFHGNVCAVHSADRGRCKATAAEKPTGQKLETPTVEEPLFTLTEGFELF
eukprot:CAMPEP_0117516030 /NCGR_PEP_ID=MMETSP0784-20121206/30884_1 /TAXON_ID=39447 /ORGANISM="" /LENGTH=208 /DNA_ID=CAMNT_0005311863 /DNA_START=304 /DNA_END=932 /DNA_ORIENTATION=+